MRHAQRTAMYGVVLCVITGTATLGAQALPTAVRPQPASGAAAPADTEKTVSSRATPVGALPVAARGIPDSLIEAVFYHWDQRYDAFQGMVMDEAVYVLLRDGTTYDRLPALLSTFDVAASRRTEPERWGRWQRRGDTYAFNWPSIGASYDTVRGNVVRASTPGTTMTGRFISGSSYTQPGGAVGMTFLSELTLTADGRFSANGTTRGTYRIEPYAIELRHDTGRIERQSFLVDGDGVILGSGRMTRKK